MKRWERPLLLFSLALNIAFLSVAATNGVRDRAEPRPQQRAELRRDGEAMRKHHARRRARLARALALDPQQQAQWDARFAHVAPALRTARDRADAARAEYQRALSRSDMSAARHAARAVSDAQASVDSLCAEVMLAEAEVLRPDQRRRYVRWTLHAGAGRRPHRDPAAPPLGPAP
jgi:hypothetical protein